MPVTCRNGAWVTCPALAESLPSAAVCAWAWTEKLLWREPWGGLVKRSKAPGLPGSFSPACLAIWGGDLLGKPGPSKYFSVSPLILKSQESFMALARRFYRRTLENVLLWGKMDLDTIPPF